MKIKLFGKIILLLICVAGVTARAQQDQPSPLNTVESLASALAETETDTARASLLAEHKGSITIELRKALYLQLERAKVAGDYQRALKIAQLMQQIAEQIDDKPGIAISLNSIGTVHFLQNNYKLAMDYFEKSLKLTIEISDKEDMAKSLYNIGLIYRTRGDYKQAIDYYQQSLALAEPLKLSELLSDIFNGFGTVYRLTGEMDLALKYYQQSLSLKESIGKKNGIAQILNNISLVYSTRGEYEQALDYLQRSLKITEETKNQPGLSLLLHNIGNIYSYQGNLRLALEYYQRSLALKERLSDKVGQAQTFNNIGLIHFYQRNFELALQFLQESLSIRESLNDRNGIAESEINIGLTYQLLGNYELAMQYYRKSLAISEALGKKVAIAEILFDIGKIYSYQNDYKMALEYHQQSLKLREELRLSTGISESLNSLSRLHYQQGEFKEAITLAERAADIARQIGYFNNLWQARTSAGKAYRALNQISQAQEAFQEAISVIESLREQVAGGEQQKERFFEGRIYPYLLMAEILISQQRYDEALIYTERAKARELLDVLYNGRIKITKAMSPQELQQEQQIIGELVLLNRQLAVESQQNNKNSRATELRDQLVRTRLNYDAFQAKLYSNHPELKSLRGETPQLSLPDISHLLTDEQSAFLEYLFVDENIYLFVIYRNSSQAINLKVFALDIKRKQLSELVAKLADSLANHKLDFRAPAMELYQLLIEPAHLYLQNRTRLIIIPDEFLWVLPFQALLSKTDRYLLEDYVISYVPSLTVLREMVKLHNKDGINKPQTNTLLAIGNPALTKQTISRSKSILMDENLAPLPEAEKQVQQLKALYGINNSKVYIGNEAREERVKVEASNYRILHFATHGVIDNSNPLYSYILLSQTGEDSKDDGLLEAWEFMNMDLKADMVVLSACETARGRIAVGEGIIGFSWALFVAGCPTTVVSHWKVDSISTSALMLEFHRNIKQQLGSKNSVFDSALALRIAALRLLRTGEYRHPFYWASFAMIGLSSN